jgi:uncharacterized membrane protein
MDPDQPTPPPAGPPPSGEPPAQTPDPRAFEHMPTEPGGRAMLREEDKLMLLFAYLSLLAIIPYVRARDSEFVKFHARQGLALAIIGVVSWGIVHIPLLGLVGIIALAGSAALSLVGIVRALEGTRWRMPIAADVADKLGL